MSIADVSSTTTRFADTAALFMEYAHAVVICSARDIPSVDCMWCDSGVTSCRVTGSAHPTDLVLEPITQTLACLACAPRLLERAMGERTRVDDQITVELAAGSVPYLSEAAHV